MHDGMSPGWVSSRNGAHRLGRGQIQRVMFFGKSMSRTRCTGGLVDALKRHGLDVRWLNMATLRRWHGRTRAERRARREFDRFRPDLVFVFCRDLSLELLRDFHGAARVVVWIEDLLPDPHSGLGEYLSHTDLVSMSALQYPRELHDHGVENIMFQPSGFSPRFHYPAHAHRGYQRDVAFIGGPGLCGQRAQVLAEVSRHFHTEVFGVGRAWERWQRYFPELRVRRPLRNGGYRRVCATSRIVLGMNEVNDVPLYTSNRTFLTLGCGAFHLTHHVPGIDNLFGDGEHLALYGDTEHCIEQVARYLSMEDERQAVALAGHQLAMKAHQYFHRIERILQVVTGEGASQPLPRHLERGLLPAGASLSLASGSG